MAKKIVCGYFLYDAGFERCFPGARRDIIFGILPFEATYHGPWGLQPRTWRSRQNMGAEQNGKKSVYHIRDFYLRHFAGTGKGTWKNWRRNTFVFLKSGWYIPALEYSGCNEGRVNDEAAIYCRLSKGDEDRKKDR